MSPQEAKTLALKLIESGEEEQQGILMLVIGVNRFKRDPMPGLYRLRIGKSRLIFRYAKSSERLEFLILIKRQDLGTWLRCYWRQGLIVV